jgi:tol-pal system protein YbgF
MLRSTLRLAALPALVLTLALALPAFAQTPMDDPLDARDARRVDRMEKVVRELRDIVFKAQKSGSPVVVQPADTDQRLQDLSTRIGDLEHSLTRINGTMETTAHELDLAKRENALLKDQLKALEGKLAEAEKKVADLATPPPPPEPPPEPAKPTAAEAFTAARAAMSAGDFDAAEQAWAAFLKDYPESPKLAEARYWQGKTLTAKGANARAATAYIGAIGGWPKTTWAPDATVELARALIALKKPDDACQTLDEFAKRYPKPTAAVAAKAKAARTQAKCS